MIIESTKISYERCKDTGMAMVLIALLAYMFFESMYLLYAAVAMLLLNMIYPKLYQPVSVLWFGLSHLLGNIASRVILSIIYLAVVTPVGIFRRLLGKDPLKLDEFKSSRHTVMHVRNHKYIASDIEHPY